MRTVKGTENLKLSQFDEELKHILLDKGATDKEGKTGHHTALVLPLVPKDVDKQMAGLMQRLQEVETRPGIGSSRLHHDIDADSYVEKDFAPGQEQEDD